MYVPFELNIFYYFDWGVPQNFGSVLKCAASEEKVAEYLCKHKADQNEKAKSFIERCLNGPRIMVSVTVSFYDKLNTPELKNQGKQDVTDAVKFETG